MVIDWKAKVDAWPRATRGYEADVGLLHIPGDRDLYLDGVLSLANPDTYPGCENKAGKVAELWARRKNLEHPVFDRNTGRRLQPFDFRISGLRCPEKQAPENCSVPDAYGLPLDRVSLGPLPSLTTNT